MVRPHARTPNTPTRTSPPPTDAPALAWACVRHDYEIMLYRLAGGNKGTWVGVRLGVCAGKELRIGFVGVIFEVQAQRFMYRSHYKVYKV